MYISIVALVGEKHDRKNPITHELSQLYSLNYSYKLKLAAYESVINSAEPELKW